MSEQTQRLIAVAAVVVAVVAVGLDNLAFKEVDESPGTVRFLVLAVLCVAVAAAIFRYLLPAMRRKSGEGNRMAVAAFVLGLMALTAIIVFWTGLPFVLGAGAVVLGRLGEKQAEQWSERTDDERRTNDRSTRAFAAGRATLGWAATAMGALAVVAGVVLFVAVIVY